MNATDHGWVTPRRWLLALWRGAFPAATTIKPRMSKVIDGYMIVNRGDQAVTILDIHPWGCRIKIDPNADIIAVDIRSA